MHVHRRLLLQYLSRRPRDLVDLEFAEPAVRCDAIEKYVDV